MSYLNPIFFAVLYFASAIFNPCRFLAPPRTPVPKLQDAENAKNFAHLACSLRTLRPDHLQVKRILNSPITKISYTSAGGKAGNYESLDITSTSLTYIQGRRGVEKTINEKTSSSFWNRLTKAIDISNFDKIKSDPGHALYDGVDITLTIDKGKERHSIVNGSEDSVNYSKIKPFTDLLENKLAAIRKKIVW